MTPEQIQKNIEEIRLFDRKKNDGNGVIGWVFYKNILTELSLPTIEALLNLVNFQQKTADDQQIIIDSQNEQISFLMGANSAFVQEIESLRAENKQLKDAIAQAEKFIGLIESHGLEYALSKVVPA